MHHRLIVLQMIKCTPSNPNHETTDATASQTVPHTKKIALNGISLSKLDQRSVVT